MKSESVVRVAEMIDSMIRKGRKYQTIKKHLAEIDVKMYRGDRYGECYWIYGECTGHRTELFYVPFTELPKAIMDRLF